MAMRWFFLWAALLMTVVTPTPPARASRASERAYTRGLVEFHAGRLQEALAHFDEAVAADPDDAVAAYYRGVARARSGDVRGAAEDLRKALAARDSDRFAFELGVVLSHVGAYEEALPLLERGRRLPGAEAAASFFEGLAYLRLGRLEEASERFRTALRDRALAVAGHYYSAVVALRAGRSKEASAHLEKVVRLAPSSAMGIEAGRLLGRREEKAEPEGAMFGSFGFAYDSNVALKPDTKVAARRLGIEDSADARFLLRAGLRTLLWRGRELRLGVGYEFFQSLHVDLDEFNVQAHRPVLTAVGRRGPFELGTQVGYDFFLRGTDSFLQRVVTTPWFGVRERGFGRTLIYYRMERRDVIEDDFDIRDGFLHSAGLTQYAFVDGPQRWVSAGYRFDREDPEGDRSEANRFAYDAHRFRLAGGWSFPAWLDAVAAYEYRREIYPRNSRVRSLSSRGRRDNIHEIKVALLRELPGGFDLAAQYVTQLVQSNDSDFERQRHIGSIAVTARF